MDAVDDEFSSTALHEAAFYGHLRVVELLLEASPVLVHDVDAQGRTALHIAAANDRFLIVERLLEAGLWSHLLIKAVDCYGKTALDYAKNNFNVLVRILVKDSPLNYHTPLHSAFKNRLQRSGQTVSKVS